MNTRAAHRHRESGSALIECTLVLLPLLALVFITMDSAWALFARATLQHAAREGVRYAVTATPLSGSCMNASIRQVVQTNSFGFITAANAATSITVTYLDPKTLAVVSGASSTSGGNVVQISIQGVSVRSFGPIWRTSTPLSLGAQAADVLETSPTGPPCV
jgi:Flp pilus assembly protein TadG